jgi:hypothetical protein
MNNTDIFGLIWLKFWFDTNPEDIVRLAGDEKSQTLVSGAAHLDLGTGVIHYRVQST